MSTYTLQANQSAIIRYTNQAANDHTSSTFVDYHYLDALLISFEPFPESKQYEGIINSNIYLYVTPPTTYQREIYYNRLGSKFDQTNVTYSNAPYIFSDVNFKTISYYNSPGWFSGSFQFNAQETLDYLREGVGIRFDRYHTDLPAPIYTSHSSNIPYIVVTTTGTAAKRELSSLSPTSGYIYKFRENNFSWSTKQDYPTYKSIITVSTVFKWRVAEGEQENTIELGTASSVTIPAGTFTSDSIQWSVELTFNTGDTAISKWYTLSTVEPTSTATAISPNDTILDGSVNNIFAWKHSIASGTLPTGFDLQISHDGTNWETVKSETSSATQTELTPEQIGVGDVYWRVRTYNTESVAGEWSNIAHVLSVAAPAIPAIAITSLEPRFSIRWENNSQQAYEIMVDDKIISQYFGTENEYTYTSWLDDGEHTVSVRIQNEYGLWSEWSTASLPISNVAGPEIILTANLLSPQLSWQASGYDGYVVYRDGEKIAETISNSFIDNFANGEVKYQVRGFYSSSGNYGISNEVTAIITYQTLNLFDTATGAQISLGRATRQTRQTSVQRSRDVSLIHYSGDEKPTAEIGFAKNLKYSFECAFLPSEKDDIKKFLNILEHAVCLRDQYGEKIIGITDNIREIKTHFNISFSVTIQEISFDEVKANENLQLQN